MSCLLQLCSIIGIVCVLEHADSTPLFQGFSVQKGFEVNLKPFEFKPISYFIEKWSPFGRFGFRKGIQKRDLEAVIESFSERDPPPLLSPAPVFEQIDEEKFIDKRKSSDPNPVKPLLSNLIRVPLTESFKPPTEGLYTTIVRNPSVNNNILEKPVPPALKELHGELPPRPVGPIPATTASLIPPPPVKFIPAQPAKPIPAQPVLFMPEQSVNSNPGQLNIPAQTVGAAAVQSQVPQEVIPLITPPPRLTSNVANVPFSEIPPTDGPFVRGSKLALYFGNVFLQLVSQFLTNARLQFSQLRQPPPVPISN